MRLAGFLFATLISAYSIVRAQSSEPYLPTPDEIAAIEQRKAELDEHIAALKNDYASDAELVDVEIYSKAAEWILRYRDTEFYRKHYVQDTLDVLNIGIVRAESLEKGSTPWIRRKGRVVRAYRSHVDGSVQPYIVHIPSHYPEGNGWSLDLILHGRNSRLNEVSFLSGPRGEPEPESEANIVRLEVFGRTNNAYRWAGETDVFEALAHFRSAYRAKMPVILRGFSMGGAGAWHLGLHHPGQWAGVEAGAGFTDTLEYAKKSLTEADTQPWQRAAMHIYDAVDYVDNIWDVEVFVGYGGEDDAQLQASTNIREALSTGDRSVRFRPGEYSARWGNALFLIGPGMGHRWHPASKLQSEQALRHARLNRGTPRNPVEYTTYTTAYASIGPVTIDGLERHYERAVVEGAPALLKTSNIGRLILRDVQVGTRVNVDGQDLGLAPSTQLLLAKHDGEWKIHDDLISFRGDGLQKRPGLQGPIDDAFRDNFVLAMPSGKPAHAAVSEHAVAIANEFRRVWRKFLRGSPVTIDDVAVTPAVAGSSHVVVFGDPGSNSYLAEILDDLPISWDKREIRVGDRSFSAHNHVLRMIFPNPRSPSRYIVINSGHTFGEKEFRGTNALLYPRLGDWAVVRIDRGRETVAAAGFFDESWRIP